MGKTKKIPDGVTRDSKGEELRVGSVVRSVAGRDVKRVFVVTAVGGPAGDGRVVIANGELRTLEGMKHKNPMHLRLIGELEDSDIIELKNCPTDEFIGRMCKKFDKNLQ